MLPTANQWMGQVNKQLSFDNALLCQPAGGGVLERSWDKSYMETQGLKIWYWNKIPLPSSSFYACSYVFAEVAGLGLRSLVRVDVQTPNMGGGSGTIFNVKVLKSGED